MKYYPFNSHRQMHACLNSCDDLVCPEKLYIDLTEDCNLHCQMCRDRVSLKGDTMPMELYRRIVDETAPYVKSYSLFSWGESLLLNDLWERIQYLSDRKRPDAVVELSTNGMLLTEGNIPLLHKFGIIPTVSADGADKNIFEKIRRAPILNA